MAGSGTTALSQGTGYGIVLGVGLAFAVFMVSLPAYTDQYPTQLLTHAMLLDLSHPHPQTLQ